MDAFNGQADVWYYQWMNSIQSPNEFECIKLKEKKNKRTLPSGLSFSVAGFGSSSEGKKNVVEFNMVHPSDPVTTDALRLDIIPLPDKAVGILEVLIE